MLSAINVSTIEKKINQHFETLLKNVYDQGMCKKIIPLAQAFPDLPQVKGLALALTHDKQQSDKDIIDDECHNLKLLAKMQFPVVSLRSAVMKIHDKDTLKGYGVLMDFLPEHNFIEAKTPSTLKLFLTAALLGMHIPHSETWFQNKATFEQDVLDKIKQLSDHDLIAFQQRAKNALESYQAITETMQNNQFAVVDLQALISMDGKITIIDPLDAGKINDKGQFTSDRHPARKEDADLIKSIQKAFRWLSDGMLLSQKYSKVTKKEDILPLVDLKEPVRSTPMKKK